MKKDLFDWFFTKEKTFTAKEVRELLERVKEFNCGAIDDYLSKHVDNEFEQWLQEKKIKGDL